MAKLLALLLLALISTPGSSDAARSSAADRLAVAGADASAAARPDNYSVRDSSTAPTPPNAISTASEDCCNPFCCGRCCSPDTAASPPVAVASASTRPDVSDNYSVRDPPRLLRRSPSPPRRQAPSPSSILVVRRRHSSAAESSPPPGLHAVPPPIAD